MKNIRIKISMIKSGIKQWELAELLNISESALSRKLREELPKEEQDRICALIKNAGGEHDDNK